MHWKRMALPSGEDVIAEYESRRSGLSEQEVRDRLFRYGKNTLRQESSPWREILLRRLQSSFLYLLVGASVLSFALGQRLEALLIALFILINISLEAYQEYHSVRSLSLLRRYLVSHVRVRRSGEVVEVNGEEIVPGDIVLVSAGDRLVADMRFFVTTSLAIDESVMTGEADPVIKQETPVHFANTEMHQASNIGFAGTVVVSGRGEGVVIATGRETALGDIAKLTEDVNHETRFEKGLHQFSRFIVRLVAVTLFGVFIANVILRHGETSTAELLIFSLALAVSVIPEALPVIITVCLSRGSLHLIKKKVVVKRLSAIEDLGSIDILCADKTGTLTENALVVTDIQGKDEETALELASIASIEPLLHRGMLRDPFDLALWHRLSEPEKASVIGVERLEVLPFDPKRRRNSVLIRRGKETLLIVRGAYEEVLALTKLSRKEQEYWIRWGSERGKEGKRILAVASRTFARKPKLTSNLEQDLNFVGLIAFEDPVKKSAPDTVLEAKKLGITVKILTGDSKEVAGAVAHAVGLIADPSLVTTGAELMALTPDEQRERVYSQHVFARVSPEEKYLIIRLLQEKHDVGFLGEGINDAPALRLANVALVVKGAADIAKESADVVLLQRNLGTIITGIREGRTIFANILKYLRITLTSNFGNFLSVAVASLFLPFVPLLPIQILLLNLLSDFPMLAVATDTVDAEELTQPKDYNPRSVVLVTLGLGFLSSIFDLSLFTILYRQGAEIMQSAWFSLSVLTEIILIFSLRTKLPFYRSVRPSWLLIGLSFLAVGIALTLPGSLLGQRVFGFSQESVLVLPLILLLAVLYFLATEYVKRFSWAKQSFETKRS